MDTVKVLDFGLPSGNSSLHCLIFFIIMSSLIPAQRYEASPSSIDPLITRVMLTISGVQIGAIWVLILLIFGLVIGIFTFRQSRRRRLREAAAQELEEEEDEEEGETAPKENEEEQEGEYSVPQVKSRCCECHKCCSPQTRRIFDICCVWFTIIMGLLALSLALYGALTAWPWSSDQNYKSSAFVSIPETMRDQAVRTGFHHGLLIRASIDCEDDLSADEASSVTPENAWKWGRLAKDSMIPSQYNWDDADDIAQRAAAAKQWIRGHALVWDTIKSGYPDQLNDVINSASNASQAAIDAMEVHFNAIMPRYANVTRVWDVVNEPIKGDDPPRVSGDHQGPLYRALGEQYIDEAFRISRKIGSEVAPDALLILNEAVNGDWYDRDSDKGQAFLALVDRLLERNVSFLMALVCKHIPSLSLHEKKMSNTTRSRLSTVDSRWNLRKWMRASRFTKTPVPMPLSYRRPLCPRINECAKNWDAISVWV